MTGGVDTLDDELRALYAGPLDAFVGARQALAKRLKEAGNAREAEVRELRKPSVSAWAVNQLFARESREMAGLLGAGERTRTVHGHAAAGDDRTPLRDLVAAVRAALPRLVALGSQALAATGRTPGEAIVERLRNNLEALALDPAQAAIAARGWLDEDLPRPGFEVMAALQLASAPPAPSASQRPSGAATRRSGEAGVRAERPPGEDRERGKRIEQLRLELVAAERAAAERANDAERTAREAADASRRAAEARTRAEEARLAASAAERSVALAREALERSERE